MKIYNVLKNIINKLKNIADDITALKNRDYIIETDSNKV